MNPILWFPTTSAGRTQNCSENWFSHGFRVVGVISLRVAPRMPWTFVTFSENGLVALRASFFEIGVVPGFFCDWPRPTQGLPSPSGPEPRKSPKRVRKEHPGPGPQKSPKSAPRSLKRVRKESESQVSDSFRTLLRLRGALFGDFSGPGPGYSFRTLFGLFRGSGPEGLGRPCAGRGQSQGFLLKTMIDFKHV